MPGPCQIPWSRNISAAVVIIAMMGASELDVTIAWVYVGLRVVHSLWQSLVNTIPVRLSLFMLGNFMMVYLAYRAVSLTLLADPGVVA